MVKTVLNIDGMSCGMCEAHVSDAIRKVYPKAKIKASASKNIASVISDESVDLDKITETLGKLGYIVTGCKEEPYEKSNFFGSLFGK